LTINIVMDELKEEVTWWLKKFKVPCPAFWSESRSCICRAAFVF